MAQQTWAVPGLSGNQGSQNRCLELLELQEYVGFYSVQQCAICFGEAIILTLYYFA